MQVNGETVDMTESGIRTLEDLIRYYGLRMEGVAVERNGEIVPRDAIPTQNLEEGDRIELIKFVGGG